LKLSRISGLPIRWAISVPVPHRRSRSRTDSRKGEVDAEQHQRRHARNLPQDIGEGGQRDHAAEEILADLVGALHEDQDVIGDAQMRVVDFRVLQLHAIMTAVGHPQIDEAFGEPTAPAQDQHLAEIELQHGGEHGPGGNAGKQQQREQKGVPVAVLDGVEDPGVCVCDILPVIGSLYTGSREVPHGTTASLQVISGGILSSTLISPQQLFPVSGSVTRAV
jgi:hypothetical protein